MCHQPQDRGAAPPAAPVPWAPRGPELLLVLQELERTRKALLLSHFGLCPQTLPSARAVSSAAFLPRPRCPIPACCGFPTRGDRWCWIPRGRGSWQRVVAGAHGRGSWQSRAEHGAAERPVGLGMRGALASTFSRLPTNPPCCKTPGKKSTRGSLWCGGRTGLVCRAPDLSKALDSCRSAELTFLSPPFSSFSIELFPITWGREAGQT